MYEYNLILKNFYEMKNKYEEKAKEKVYSTKKTTLLPIHTKNKYGEKLNSFVLPTLFNKLPKKIWDSNGFKDLKKNLKNWLCENLSLQQ